jgi:UDP-glucose 4-epimerase
MAAPAAADATTSLRNLMKILITGGAGYIGSTIASACIDNGIEPVILDDLSTGRREFVGTRHFFEGDISDGRLVDRIFTVHPDIHATIHCAARIVVPESVEQPIEYYRNNVSKTIELVAHLRRNGCRRLVFSSSASVYAPGPAGWVDEHSPVAPSSPYARTKAVTEMALADFAAAHGLGVLSLRYFNPIGADPRLRSGPQHPDPTHVVGRLMAAYANDEPFQVTGVAWSTRDGSGIRDYVHVWDLAMAHVAGVLRFDDVAPPGRYETVNIGTGRGTTVRELVSAFEQEVHRRLRVVDGAARPGDVVGSYARSDKAARLLGWRAELGVRDGLHDAMQWDAVRDQILVGRVPTAAGAV